MDHKTASRLCQARPHIINIKRGTFRPIHTLTWRIRFCWGGESPSGEVLEDAILTSRTEPPLLWLSIELLDITTQRVTTTTKTVSGEKIVCSVIETRAPASVFGAEAPSHVLTVNQSGLETDKCPVAWPRGAGLRRRRCDTPAVHVQRRCSVSVLNTGWRRRMNVSDDKANANMKRGAVWAMFSSECWATSSCGTPLSLARARSLSYPLLHKPKLDLHMTRQNQNGLNILYLKDKIALKRIRIFSIKNTRI